MIDDWVARFLRWSVVFLLLGLAARFVPVGRLPARTLDGLWIGGDALFLTVYGVGCVFFWVAVRRRLSRVRG